MTRPPGLQGPVGVTAKDKRGLNSFAAFLTGMSRDVPRELKRSRRMRAQIRKGG